MRVLDHSQRLGVECDLGYNLQPIIRTFYVSFFSPWFHSFQTYPNNKYHNNLLQSSIYYQEAQASWPEIHKKHVSANFFYDHSEMRTLMITYW